MNLLISLISLLVLTMKKLSVPSGDFKIGTVTYDLEDIKREEYYTEQKGDKRKIKER